jgi:DNA-binding winged helix-turn-helix (wHTH) protein
MASPVQRSSVIRFGAFQLDAANGELSKAGRPVKIHPQPLRILLLLSERQGQIVTPEEIRHCLWGSNTVVEFEGGINFCVRQIRAALEDDAENPRYVQTLPPPAVIFLSLRQLSSSQRGTPFFLLLRLPVPWHCLPKR